MKPAFSNVLQVAIVVKSVDDTVRTYADEYGMGPWQIWEFNDETVSDMIIRDEKKNYAMRIAAMNIGNVEWEIIEPLDDKSIYAEFLREHGEGLHHVAFKAENFEESMKFFRDKGMIVEQGGNWCGQHVYVYLNSQKDLKVIAEIYNTQPGFKYPDPIEVYPSE
jgi:methylmalonyl-CoA/ethylmalonyl-CoA epimerase